MNIRLYARASAIIPLVATLSLIGKEGYLYKLDASNHAVICNAVTDVPHGIIGDVAPGGLSISAIPFGGNHGTVRVKLGAPVTDLRKALQLRADSTAGPDAGTGARALFAIPLETGQADELIEAILIPPRIVATGAGVITLSFPVFLNSITGAVDVVTNYVPGFAFEWVSNEFVVAQPVTTGAKAATLNGEIGVTNLTGGAIALTSANCTPLGNKVAGTAITAGNIGTATDGLSIEASAVTQFSEGSGVVLVTLRNLDTVNAG